MFNEMFQLLEESCIKLTASEKSELGKEKNEVSFINRLELTLSKNPLFIYKLDEEILSDDSNIYSSFVMRTKDGLKFVKNDMGEFYINGVKVDIADYHDYKIYILTELPRVKSDKDIFSLIMAMIPKYGIGFIFLAPFVLITPLYANVFNTKLIYNNEVNTMLYISLLFIMLVSLEVIFRKVIKDKCIELYESRSLFLERYLISISDRFKVPFPLNSIKAVEGYRRYIWDTAPLILGDVAVITLLMLALVFILQWMSIYLLTFYAFVLSVFLIHRVKMYKVMLDHDDLKDDMLSLRISMVKNRKYIPTFNSKSFLFNFESKYESLLNNENKISTFNFNWDEMSKCISFLSMVVLFTVVFFGINSEIVNPALLIVLLILNSRFSALITSIVVKVFYFVVCSHHLKLSLSALFNEININENAKFMLNDVESIKLEGVNIYHDTDLVIKSTTLKLNAGTIYGVSGNVGAGKSTFLKTLINLHHDYKGRIVYGKDILLNNISKSFFERYVSYLDSESDFLYGSLHSNFLIRGCYDKQYMSDALKLAMPDRQFDYDSFFVDDISTMVMSTGQKRKLLFLMTMYGNKKIYILDEVFNGLSVDDTKQYFELIKKSSKNAIIVIASHNKSVIASCDKVIHIKNKRIIVDEKVNTVIKIS